MARSAAAERPRNSQILAMTLLVLLAWLPLIPFTAPYVNVYIGILLALRLASLRWPAIAPGRWLLLPLTLAGILNAFSAYRTFFGYEGGTALLATMSALKLLEMNRIRDIRFGTVLYGFLLVSQFLFNESLWRALYLAVLLLLDFALMADLTARSGPGRQAFVGAVRRAGTYALQALPLVVVVFFLFPRLSAPLWSLPVPSDRGRTGMSDWMEPGSLNEVVRSREPAFRVRFDGPMPAADRLYWRGPVAWYTNGRRWTGWPPGVPLGAAEPLAVQGEEIRYRMETEATGQNWLFALDLPVAVPADARILGDFRVLVDKPVKEVRIDDMTSALHYDSGDLDLDQEAAGTQLPDNVTARMRALVAGWRREASGDAEVVARALRHFREEPFYYSLAPPRLEANPLDTFLFQTRSGYCEHYAGAFVLLMRIAGIPSRVVLGYLGGEYNPLGNYLLVRQSDAHAWAEVWLEGQGWVRIDPTAAVHPDRIDADGLLEGLGTGTPWRFRPDDIGTLRRLIHNLGLLGDAVETGWRNWVIGLTSERQQRMLETLGLGRLSEYGLAIALLIAGAAISALLLLTLTRPAGPRDPVDRLYARFCRRLARIGLPRAPGEGPADYGRRVRAARPDLAQPVQSFLELYLPMRYGAGDWTPHRRALAQRLERLRPRRRTAV